MSLQSCLFECLKKTKLIEDVSKAKYSRCGRTDKGVSALGQVIALDLRTNLLEGPGVRVQEGSIAHTRKGDTEKELPYMVILNRNLPDDIRVLSWTPVDPDFSARFSCVQRTYKYFFPKGDMNLEVWERKMLLNFELIDIAVSSNTIDIILSVLYRINCMLIILFCDQAMRTAALYFIGEHDFRNFCKVKLLLHSCEHSILRDR